MKKLVMCLLAFPMMMQSRLAHAWGSQGDYYIGNVAWELLNSDTKQRVTAILGNYADGRPVTLADATDWSNCVLSVKRQPDGKFEYVKGAVSPGCDALAERPGGAAEMIDYVSRNWEQYPCPFPSAPKVCHRSYHFTEIDMLGGSYRFGRYGSGPYDLVHAASAAIAALTNRPFSRPFDLRGEREALFVLAHSVADIHQPLHVATVYLDDEGKPIDPNNYTGERDRIRNTGAARIRLAASGDFKVGNFHEVWDVIDFDARPDPLAICAALTIKPVDEPLGKRPEVWASQTVMTARDVAFQGLVFQKEGTGWQATIADRPAYEARRRDQQRESLALAGARLAETLNAIYSKNAAYPKQSARRECSRTDAR